MGIGGKIVLVFLGMAFFGLSGCASNSQTFIGPSGEIKNCASTSMNQGVGGVLLANSRFNKCVEQIKSLGYKELETVGTIGISIYNAEADGLKVMKVFDNSPAAKAGIVRGDLIVAINGNKVLQSNDFAATQGSIGSPVDLTINRSGNLATFKLVRAKSDYSRLLETVVY
jgi:carboxyl-terminal processing protease